MNAATGSDSMKSRDKGEQHKHKEILIVVICR